jgi:hypothetical protein
MKEKVNEVRRLSPRLQNLDNYTKNNTIEARSTDLTLLLLLGTRDQPTNQDIITTLPTSSSL